MIKRQVAEFYEVTERTIDNLIEKYNSDLTKNGYDIIRGKRLTYFKLVFAECFDGEMDFIVKINTSLSCDSVNLGYLESTLELMQVDDYYPTFEDKLVHLIWSVNRNHSFSDGNKRLSITLGLQFLSLNGYLYCISRYCQENQGGQCLLSEIVVGQPEGVARFPQNDID